MTQRGRGRRSFRRAPRAPMSWFNDGIDVQNLAGSTSLTSELMQTAVLPEGFISGMTILRLLVRISFAAQAAADVVNAIAAFYVATRPSLTTPPNLNADLLDYYLFAGLQAPTTAGAVAHSQVYDIRSMRRIRGEDRGLFFRVTNNEVTGIQVGMEMRALLRKS